MDEMKGKVKDFMKKVNKPFSSSSPGKFKGQGRVLGSGSSSCGPVNHNLPRSSQNVPQKQNPPVIRSGPNLRLPKQNHGTVTESTDPRTSIKGDPKPASAETVSSVQKQEGFDPFGPLISSGRGSKNGNSVNVFECPVCGSPFKSVEEVSIHVESCLNDSFQNSGVIAESSDNDRKMELRNEFAGIVGVFISGGPSKESIDVVLKLLRNIVKEPGNDKFRRIRMSNPRIRDAVGTATGGMELLEFVGFKLQEEGEDTFSVLEMPSEEQIFLIKEAISLLEPPSPDNSSSVASSKVENPVEQKKIDRQVRVFFSVPESVAAKIELPDSFYNLSAEELKREADLRKKKIAESQLLIPKSYKEKQAKAARKRYKAAVIRVQFPDGVVLQGVFLPWESTTALYEFVSSALKEASLEFELLQPAIPKSRVVPRFPRAGERTPTLVEEDMVPAALVKFKPIETDDVVFTGLRNELLEASEPLNAAAAVAPPTG